MTNPTKPEPEENSGPSYEERIKEITLQWSKAETEGRHEEANCLGLELLELASEAAEQNPSEDSKLWEEAHFAKEAGDWKRAEEAYLKRLHLKENVGHWGMLCKAHYDLSGFYSLLGQNSKAYDEALCATAYARQVELRPLLHLALENQAWCTIRLNQLQPALKPVSEWVENSSTEKMFEPSLIRALITRARCNVELLDLAAAGNDLQSAWLLLEQRSKSGSMAGIQGALAIWWETSARLRQEEADFEQAVRAWREAVRIRQNLAAQPHISRPSAGQRLFDALHHLSLCYAEMHQEQAAADAHKESMRVRSVARLPSQ